MEPAQPQQDPLTRLALQHLADISVPPPVSWMPQTWGWAMLALVAAALLIVALWRWHRRRVSNRYRREALAELTRMERDLADNTGRAQALEAMPELLKRVALAAWPRDAVASLSGGNWLAFLRQHGGDRSFPEPAARLLDDLEYRSQETRMSVSEDDARMFAAAARRWIEGHSVSA
ncbi:protein of unknown function [Mesorhizobium albiziae]|uniref:DUF4381 domain-containing protein n=1 Tax=Neomesorhizobium albiziae TaxID=335020 RepID=A0A1I4CD01_9HYPH|nr:DUF4381 domain-containing protein [Mesorhizobium albiziae]GLS29532.1 hypothetical protein GCM10007937_12400 [Mesorhizobium albiziae]SFK78159.1 protein of unknown function [Mesorhizobium albiziae]